MSKTGIAVFGVLAVLAAPAEAQTRTVYVPGVFVVKSFTPPSYVFPQFRFIMFSGGGLYVYNSRSSTGQATHTRAFGTDGPMTVLDAGGAVAPNQPRALPASASIQNGIVMDEFVLSDGLVATATFERINMGPVDLDCSAYPPPVPGAGSGDVAQGRIPLPIFEDLFPAGAMAVSGDVIPFNIGPPPPICAQEYRRRINVTLFNGGSQPATFAVRGRVEKSPGDVFSATYEVPAESVRQFNSIYSPEHAPFPDFPHLFFVITADQPFLAYVSTTFDDPLPGAIPYEIFPAKLK